MVSLPELDQYSPKDLDDLLKISPIFNQYRGVINSSFENLSDQIRKEKHEAWLRCAFATLTDSHTPEEICRFWSAKSESLIMKAWSNSISKDSLISLLAFGKLGSNELNLSSDIDIVFVKDKLAPSNNKETQEVKSFINILNDVRPTGFAFRVDTSLRPGGNASPLLPTQDNFFNFYDSYLEAWHRISFVRLRAITGPEKLNQSLLEYCHRLCYPRRLDYSIINSIKNIRSKLQSQWRKANEPLDVKFHPGGIRDIELYIQCLQVIYGGHKHTLQTSSFSQALEQLRAEAILPQQEYDFLNRFYWKLRKIENHIHAINDQHTYKLTDNIRSHFRFKFEDKNFYEELNESNHIISDFFVDEKANVQTNKLDTSALSQRAQKAISDIDKLSQNSLKRSSVEKQKSELLDKYIAHVDSIAIDGDLALESFRDFIFSIKSKSSIFFLLNRHDKLLENIAWLFSFSPYIGTLLCQRPELTDSFALGHVDIDENDDIEDLLESLTDYKLMGQIISISYLLKNNDINIFCENLSLNADLITNKLLKKLINKWQSQNIEILCLGKWAAFELGIQSDLDFVFLCDDSPKAAEMKVARRFINLMSTPTKAGKLYNIDIRLKPSQSSGPLLMKRSDLISFMSNKAEAWQKQAYLKSRFLSKGTTFYNEGVNTPSVTENELKELTNIHSKLLVSRSDKKIDLKYAPGGLVESEFRLQWLALKQNKVPTTARIKSFLDVLDAKQEIKSEVYMNYLQLRSFEQVYQVCLESSSTKVPINHPVLERLSKVLKIGEPFKHLVELTERQHELLKLLDPTP